MVPLIVSLRDDVIATRVEPDGIIPVGFPVLGTDSPYVLDDLGIICHENIWTDSGDVAYESWSILLFISPVGQTAVVLNPIADWRLRMSQAAVSWRIICMSYLG